ncbi:MAG TPA: choice-of-anchor tandem repeat GloVer-containing protein, partial [Bacteroidia bacterium]|nr:choice-of-anchor tandem repeat GloVer-containing protein [Bacteroidia bacterium]
MKKVFLFISFVVIAITANAQYTNLLNFTGATNGNGPVGSLISDGTFFYGLTQSGGTNNLGTLFKIMPDGSGYVKLLDFAGATNGSYPLGSLFYDGTFLYGTTEIGGANNLGTLFRIMPDGTGYLKLLDFTGAGNGSSPNGTLISDGTFLYGMTYQGGINGMGVIFKIMPDGTG